MFYAVTREGAWLRAVHYHPAMPVVRSAGRRDEVARAILTHVTGDEDLAHLFADAMVDEVLGPVPDGGLPVVIHAADLLRWVVRRLRQEAA